ncbi:Uncharacterised protein [Chromobacterium violaceum]|uniref:Uncharacterized protein n=1 Tax=Chromobacterium violaceum TaxID=536 RepID=A0A3S4HPJ7_CHRVL|nr:Uncharacterised protein [Chromobacterium violaceum]
MQAGARMPAPCRDALSRPNSGSTPAHSSSLRLGWFRPADADRSRSPAHAFPGDPFDPEIGLARFAAGLGFQRRPVAPLRQADRDARDASGNDSCVAATISLGCSVDMRGSSRDGRARLVDVAQRIGQIVVLVVPGPLAVSNTSWGAKETALPRRRGRRNGWRSAILDRRGWRCPSCAISPRAGRCWRDAARRWGRAQRCPGRPSAADVAVYHVVGHHFQLPLIAVSHVVGSAHRSAKPESPPGAKCPAKPLRFRQFRLTALLSRKGLPSLP